MSIKEVACMLCNAKREQGASDKAIRKWLAK